MKRFSLLVLCLLGMVSCTSSFLGGTLKKYGYREVRPAAQYYEPGTILHLEQYTATGVQAGITCSRQEAVGNTKLLDSTTAEYQLIEKIHKEFSLDANYLAKILPKAQLKILKTVTLSLTNPRIYEISDAEVIRAINHHQRSPECEQAIKMRKNNGEALSMISRGLEADVSYKVSFDTSTSISVEVKQEVLKGLAAHLGFSLNVEGESMIVGKGLYWGIIDDKALVLPSPPFAATMQYNLDPTRSPMSIAPLANSIIITINKP